MAKKGYQIPADIDWQSMSSIGREKLMKNKATMLLGRVLLVIGLLFLIILFLPWRQTIPGRGIVTALRPEDRPQTIQNQIGGRIEDWLVQEGDEVKAGDTILVLSETSQSYFDPELSARLQEQLAAKGTGLDAAKSKMEATEAQMEALTKGLEYQLTAAQNKVEQATNTVQIDSADLIATESFYQTSKARLKRYEQGYKNGLFSLTDIETRRLNLQEDEAKVVSARNKLSNSRQSLANAILELGSIRLKYREALAKAQSDLGSALSSKASAEGDIAKLRNEIANVSVRRSLYVVRAPQSGHIVKTLKAGIGENIKEGESIATLQPQNPLIAAEIYVDAMDVPLITENSDVRLQFEGWPSVQFSGWPSVAIGTFAGKVAVIDRVGSANGKYRLLVRPTEPLPKKDEPWPEQLRLGSGAFGRIILRSVPVWYEIWRQVNGFPPNLEKEPKEPKN